ncbi:MAG: shikimate kinase [Patescibacteria group bacterium]
MIKVPGSKSIAQRALLAAALGNKKITLHNVPHNEDLNVLIEVLKQVGIKISQKGEILTVQGSPWKNPKGPLNFKENATALRLFLGAALGRKIQATFKGSARLAERPLQPLLDAYKNLSTKNRIKLPGNWSSQFASSILFYEKASGKKINLEIEGDLVSAPYFELTKKILKEFEKSPTDFYVEADLSSACPFLLWSMLSKQRVELEGIQKNNHQADQAVLEAFESLGATLKFSKNGLQFTPPKEMKKSWKQIDIKNFPDGALSLILFAPFLKESTNFRGISHLAFKESDRLEGIKKALNNLNVSYQIKKGELTIEPGWNPPAAKLQTQKDHRLAMNFGILSQVFPKISLDQPQCTEKSFPDFWKVLKQNCAPIVLIGSRGTGKSTLGPALAKALKLDFIDLDEELEKENKTLSKLKNEELTWVEFRLLEEQKLAKLLPGTRRVISTGGGTAESEKNRKLLKEHAYVIYLDGNTDLIEEGLKTRKHQPQYPNSLRDDMKKRQALYAPIADHQLWVTPWDTERFTQELLESLRA